MQVKRVIGKAILHKLPIVFVLSPGLHIVRLDLIVFQM